MKKILVVWLAGVMALSTLAACGRNGAEAESIVEETAMVDIIVQPKKESDPKDLKGTLTFAVWDDNLYAYIQSNDIAGKFKEQYPNINIEVEKIKNDSKYWEVMEQRASINGLPDIMLNKAFTLSKYQSYLLDLSDLEAAQNNELASGYKVGGRILGIPMTAGYEYVYYWQDMFEEAGVSVPGDWGEFVEASKKLQEYYGKSNENFRAISCGLKDEFPDYPFMEFMPALESGNGQNWNSMARMDEPFMGDTDIHKAYHKVYDLFSSGVFGKEPLEIDTAASVALFAEKNAAMIALGDWGLQDIRNQTSETDELGSFYLPTRDSEEEDYNVIVQGDAFMGITSGCKNQEAARAFVEWFYSDHWYPDYLNYVTAASSMANYQKEKDPVHAKADELCPDIKLIMYDGGGDDFTAIQERVDFNYKRLGVQMFGEGFDLDEELTALDDKWSKARREIGIE